MIDKREILETVSSFSLLRKVVEKDFVLGWILAGINGHEYGKLDLQGRHLSQEVLLRDLPLLRGSGFWPAR
jgi:hypothetical protein